MFLASASIFMLASGTSWAQSSTFSGFFGFGDSLTDNLWAEMSLMMVLVVIVLALAWRYVW